MNRLKSQKLAGKAARLDARSSKALARGDVVGAIELAVKAQHAERRAEGLPRLGSRRSWRT